MMAADGETEEDPDWQQIEREIKCPLCDKVFIDPKTTPCLHTFCKECLETLMEVARESSQHTRCPLCQVVLPRHLGFPNDFRIKRLIEIFNNHLRNVKAKKAASVSSGPGSGINPFHGCGKCEENLPVVSWCVECQVLLCHDCNEIHGKWKEFRMHNIIMLEEYVKHPEDFMMKKQSSDDEQVAEQGENENDETQGKASLRMQGQMSGKTESSKNQTDNTADTASLSKEGNKSTFGEFSQEDNRYPLYVARFDYSATAGSDLLSFSRGDFFYVINDEEDWWYAETRYPGEKGYIPSNYLKRYISLEAFSWYGGAITQKAAENILMQPSWTSGTFLVRDCDTKPGEYIVSLRDDERVRHYQILSLDDEEFCISLRRTFKSIPDLISHYSQQDGELCEALKNPCVILRERRIIRRWEIRRNDIQFTRMMGLHEHVEVWEGKWRSTPITIKMSGEGFVSIARFFEEVELMKQLKHSNIIEFYGICIQQNSLCITEFTNCGNLQAYLRAKGYWLMNDDLITMSVHIASAMHYLERKRCIHRRLQAWNIMLQQSSNKFICKVANFTYARIVTKDDYVESSAQEMFPVKWTAPECLRTKRFTTKSDVWSFGIVLYELITVCGCDLYPELSMNEKQKLLEKLDSGHRMSRPPGCPVELHDIMMECWRGDADDRPTFGSLQHKLSNLL